MSTNISHDFWYMKSHILMLLTEDTTCSCCANDSKMQPSMSAVASFDVLHSC